MKRMSLINDWPVFRLHSVKDTSFHLSANTNKVQMDLLMQMVKFFYILIGC